MPQRLQKNVNNASGNPGTYGGFLTGPSQEEAFTDVTEQDTTPAVVGAVLVLQNVSTNTGGDNYIQSATAVQKVMHGSYGVVKIVASAINTDARIQFKGVCTALVQSTANTGKSITAGDPLVLAGDGTLTSSAATAIAGSIVAISMATMAGTTTPAVLTLVDLGGSY